MSQLEQTGVLRPAARLLRLMTIEQFMAKSSDPIRALESQPVSLRFGGPLCTRARMDAVYGEGKWVPMLRFDHIQPNGKHRPNDDGKRYGHSDACGAEETLDCCTPTQPAIANKTLPTPPSKCA